MLCTYETLKKTKVKTYSTISDWFQLIKHSDKSIEIIEARQNFGDDKKAFTNFKETKLPCITYNFLFKENRENKNIVSATGYLYIDFDKPEFDITKLDKDKIYAYYKSCSGKGYALIVRVEGLTLKNFNSTYNSICNDLGVNTSFDKSAKKATQPNLLSYDPDLFQNENSKIYQAVEPVKVEKAFNAALIVGKEIEDGSSLFADKALRFDDTSDIPIPEGQDYVVNWEGYDVVRCFLPFDGINKTLRRLTDGRKRFMLSYFSNFLWLNPTLSLFALRKIMCDINELVCETPLSFDKLTRMAESIFKQLHEGNLTPRVDEHKRKIVFRIGLKWTWEEKMIIVHKELSKRYSDISKIKLQTIIDNWDFESWGLISQRKIAKYGKMSNHTILKHIKPFSSLISDLNSINSVCTPFQYHEGGRHIGKGSIHLK